MNKRKWIQNWNIKETENCALEQHLSNKRKCEQSKRNGCRATVAAETRWAGQGYPLQWNFQYFLDKRFGYIEIRCNKNSKPIVDDSNFKKTFFPTFFRFFSFSACLDFMKQTEYNECKTIRCDTIRYDGDNAILRKYLSVGNNRWGRFRFESAFTPRDARTIDWQIPFYCCLFVVLYKQHYFV